MLRRSNVFFAVTATLCLLGISSAAPYAAEARDKKTISTEISKTQAAQVELEKQSETLQTEVDQLKDKLVSMAKDMRHTEDSLADTSEKLKSLKTQKRKLAAKLYDEHGRMGGLVTAAQRFNRTSTPTMLVENAPLDAARAALVMKSMIPALHAKSTLLRDQLDQIGKLEADIAEQQSDKSRALSRIHAQEKELASSLEKRKALYHQTEAERSKQKAEVARLTKEAKTLDDLVEKIKLPVAKPARTSNADKTAPSGLIAPVSGTIRTSFGGTDDLGAASKGITYNARSGAGVSTPLAGKVRFAGPFRKYKHILIIEHPEGYHSLISGLGRVDTVVGASLAAGEPVGIVAETEAENHPVYYELRHNGAPVNPQKILIAQRKQDKS